MKEYRERIAAQNAIQFIRKIGYLMLFTLAHEGYNNADNLVITNTVLIYILIIASGDIAVTVNADNTVKHKLTVIAAVEGQIVFFEPAAHLFKGYGIATVSKHRVHTNAVGFERHLAVLFEHLRNNGIHIL